MMASPMLSRIDRRTADCLQEDLLGLLPFQDLGLERLVGRGQLGGPIAHPELELVASLSERLFRASLLGGVANDRRESQERTRRVSSWA